jgi:OOP family OmpA-OmpF porin
MTSKHPLRLLALAALGAFAASAALAQDSGYYYGGLSVGQTRAKIDQERLAAWPLPAGVSTLSVSSDKRDTGVKVFGGYQITPGMGVEAGYFSLGRFGLESTTTPPGNLSARVKVQGVNLDLVGTFPLSQDFAVLARIGGQWARTRDNFVGSGAVVVASPDPSRRALNLKIGAGLQYAFSPSFLVRAEIENYRLADPVGGHFGANLISLSAVFPFGRSPAPARRAMAAPASYLTTSNETPVRVEPARVAPVAVPVAAVKPVAYMAPPRKKVSFSAESLFGFDLSVLRPEGKLALDTFARELDGTDYDVITVQGHADRIGTQSYNQALSEQRGQAVKAYLVGTGRIAPEKVAVLGKSENEPVTRPEDCKGDQASAKLIACLAPDRRVDIEVTGTQR